MHQNMPLSVEVLLVTADSVRDSSITRIFNHSKWRLLNSGSLAEANELICSRRIGVVICNQNVADGTWKDLVAVIKPQPNAPKLMVASENAGTALWREALELGADWVLQIPFDQQEVFRSVSDAWLRWNLTRVAETQFAMAAKNRPTLERKLAAGVRWGGSAVA